MPNAVITGATHGIGKAIAEVFLQQGFSIAICARSAKDLAAVAAKWKQRFPEAEIIAFEADLKIPSDVKAFGETVLNTFGEVDVLVNNVGLFFPGLLATEPEGQLEDLMAVNVYSAYHLTRMLLPGMKLRKSGHIFNMCSVASLKAYDNGGAYSITKYALQGFSDNLRHELMADRIKVTAIMPGATYSRSWQSSGLPEERFMKTEDIAQLVWSAYALSPSACVETIIVRPIAGDI